VTYLLDSDSLITSKNGPYAFELCPGFWVWLDDAIRSGTVRSIQAVLDELVVQEDELAEWARARQEMFLAPDPQTASATGDLIAWATASTHYNDRAKFRFAQGADVQLIAHAQVHGSIVVTHERTSNEEGRIKIPNAAAEVRVRVMSPYVMLRREQARFVLAGVA
jgi:uncharacterized protein DUF4411